MDDELLSEILAAERDIRLQIDELEDQVAQELKELQQELDSELANVSQTLQEEREGAQRQAEAVAGQEAEAILEGARAFARRLENLTTPKLDEVVRRHLVQILPTGAG